MIKAVKELLADLKASDNRIADVSERDLHMISAALMTEVMVADGNAGEGELAALKEILVEEFRFPPVEADSFIALAREKVETATSLFEFTDVVNNHFDNGAKFSLVRHLWQVALADGVIHKLEEATIRKVADLIYLPHSAFIRAKQESR